MILGDAGLVRDELLAEFRARGGVLARRDSLRIASATVIDSAIRSGDIVRAFPSVYVLRELATDPHALDRAALEYVPGAAISHTSALRVRNVTHDAAIATRHLTTGPRAQVRTTSGVVVHRHRDFRCESPMATTYRGLHVVPIETAIVTSWPLIVAGERRKPAITAVSNGQTTGARLRAALDAIVKPAGASEMRALFALLAEGCRSELELWGHERVFASTRLPQAVLQHVVATPGGRFILDRAYLEELVGVELDGAAWHGSAAQRERDVRRDAALAAAGWLIVRFTHARLHSDPAGCRDELRQILKLRRRQLWRA